MNKKDFFKSFRKYIMDKMKKRKLKRFYLEKKGNGKSYAATLFDSIVFKLLFSIASFAFFYFRTEDMWFSIIISVQFLILFSLITYKVNKIKMAKTIKKVNGQVAKREIYKDLTNETPYDFVENIRDNLGKCNIDNLEISSERDLDLIGYFHGEKIGIKCLQYNSDYKVNINIIREFFLSLRKHDLKEGIVITTSSFSEDVKDFLPKLQKHVKIHVIGLDKLIEIMKRAETYPSEKEIQSIILNEIAHKKRRLKEYRDTVLSKGKTTRYILIGIMIYFLGKATNYRIYYTAVSIILITLGIFSIGNHLLGMIKSDVEDKNDSII